jgi:hypothetical protein
VQTANFLGDILRKTERLYELGLRGTAEAGTALEDTAAASSKAFVKQFMFALYQANWQSEAAAIRAVDALQSAAT